MWQACGGCVCGWATKTLKNSPLGAQYAVVVELRRAKADPTLPFNFKFAYNVGCRPLIWQQGALTRVEKHVLPSFTPADFLGTGFPPTEAKKKEGSIFTTSLLPD